MTPPLFTLPAASSRTTPTRARSLAPTLLLLALAFTSLTLPTQAQLPSAPTPQTPVTQTPAATPSQLTCQPSSPPATLTGTLTDRDGASIPNARLTLTPTSPSASAAAPLTATSAPDGSYTFSTVPPGSYQFSTAAPNFTPTQTSIQLPAADDCTLNLTLRAGSTLSVQVSASTSDIAQAQLSEEEHQHVLGFVPNFYVSYLPDPVPLSTRQKYQLAFRTMVDPASFLLVGAAAGAQQASHSYAWELGASGFGKRYAADYGTLLTGTFIGSAVLPSLLHQDPRYFYKGTGSIRSRTLYAIANAVICKGDNHRWQPNYSSVLGGLASAALANLYYPAANRDGPALTFENAALGTGFTAAANLLQEFLLRKLTPHIPTAQP